MSRLIFRNSLQSTEAPWTRSPKDCACDSLLITILVLVETAAITMMSRYEATVGFRLIEAMDTCGEPHRGDAVVGPKGAGRRPSSSCRLRLAQNRGDAGGPCPLGALTEALQRIFQSPGERSPGLQAMGNNCANEMF